MVEDLASGLPSRLTRLHTKLTIRNKLTRQPKMTEGPPKENSWVGDFLARRQKERDLIAVLENQFLEIPLDERITGTFTLLDIGQAEIFERKVLVERNDRINKKGEAWAFINPIKQPKNLQLILDSLPETQLAIDVLAREIESATEIKVDPRFVLQAAIQTKVLVDNFRMNEPARFLELEGGPEGLLLSGLLGIILVPGVTQPRLLPIGYRLEYYSVFLAMNEVLVHSHMRLVEYPQLDFANLFPAVLFFATHVKAKAIKESLPL